MAFVGTDWPSHSALPPSFYCDASNWVKAVSNAFHSSRSAAIIIHVPDSAPNSDFRNSSNTCAHLFFGLPLVRYPSSGIQVNRVVDQRLSSRRITWPAYVHLRRRCPCTQSSIFNVSSTAPPDECGNATTQSNFVPPARHRHLCMMV